MCQGNLAEGILWFLSKGQITVGSSKRLIAFNFEFNTYLSKLVIFKKLC